MITTTCKALLSASDCTKDSRIDNTSDSAFCLASWIRAVSECAASMLASSLAFSLRSSSSLVSALISSMFPIIDWLKSQVRSRTHFSPLNTLHIFTAFSHSVHNCGHTRGQVCLCSLAFINHRLEIQRVKSTVNTSKKIKTNHHVPRPDLGIG